jgi:8-oxo-dGTP pyrophosphatase MutT (NUDIX family)
MTDIQTKLQQIFAQPLPGEAGQILMSPSNRFPGGLSDDRSAARNCSVMLLLYQQQGEWRIIFMKRPSYDGVHSGQVSFPGGKWEQQDKDAWDAAVRETIEEIGITKPIVKLGQLTSIYIPHSNSLVYPMVGMVDEIGILSPDSFEVEQLIEAPLFDFYQAENLGSFTFKVAGETISAPCYNIEGHCIWGATAMIMSEFLCFVKPYSDLFIAQPFCNAQTLPEYL